MQLIGILNLTPDSFSDGGKNLNADIAIENARRMVSEGASYIDVGAESTRPGAKAVSPAEEWERLEPFLSQAVGLPISLDTRNYETAEKAFYAADIKILNDVSGFSDPKMLVLAARKQCLVIVMHSLTVPADKNIILTTPPVATIKDWIKQKLKTLMESDIKKENIIFDIGIGFGKTAAQSQELISKAQEIAEFCHNLGVKLLYGHSRKSFLGQGESNKDAETARITARLAAAKVDFARVHDIKSNLLAVKSGKI